MKRILCLLLTLLLLLSVTACGGQSDPEPAPSSSDSIPETESPTEPETEPSTEPETEPATQPEPEETVLSVNDYVAVWKHQQVIFDDSVGNHYDISFTIPMLTLEQADALAINEEIQNACQPSLDDTLQAQENGTSPFLLGISYDAWLNNNLLTLLVHVVSMTDNDWYLLYTVDITTGRRLDNDDFAALLECDRATLDEHIRSTMESDYMSRYGSLFDQDPYAQEQLDNTCSDENVAAAQVYLDQTGNPCLLCTIYSLVGAASYERLLQLD